MASISSLCIAFFREFRASRTTLGCHSLRSLRFLRFSVALPVRGGDRSCRVPLFRLPFFFRVTGSHLAPLFRSSVLRSSRLSSGFITTTTSADFRSALTDRISPGQCHYFQNAPHGSTSGVSDDFRVSLFLASSPTPAASLPFRVPTVVPLSSALSSRPLSEPDWPTTTVGVIASVRDFSP